MRPLDAAAALPFPHDTAPPVAVSLSAADGSYVRARYSVDGVADAGLLARVLEPVAKLGLVPEHVRAARGGNGARSSYTVDLSLTDVSPRHAELVAMALKAIVGVRRVITTVEAVRCPN